MKAAKPIPYRPEGPQPLVREASPGRDYPVEALGPLREAVEAVQGATLAPVALPAQSALAAASLIVQGHADVETLGGPRPTSIFALTIARSGERKSACFGPFLKELHAFEKEQHKIHRQVVANWQNKLALWKGAHDSILGKARKAGSEMMASAQADLDALGPEPPRPPSPERIVTEPTFEGLTRLFAEGQSSLGIFSDEGGQFLGGYAMNKENRQKTLAALNDLWQGNPIRRTRGGDGSLTLYGRRLATHLMVQPGVAQEFMSDPMAADTGFLSRFLVCEPTSNIGKRLHGKLKPNEWALSVFSDLLRHKLQTSVAMDPETRELQPRVLPLSPKAYALLVQFSDTMEHAQGPGGDYENLAAASKVAEQAARIAGVLTLWADLQAESISGETMADGIELAQYYLSEARRLSDAAAIQGKIELAEKLRVWLVERWPEQEVLTGDVLQKAPVCALRARPTAKMALDILVEAGWLVPLEPGTMVRGKSRKEAYRIVRE